MENPNQPSSQPPQPQTPSAPTPPAPLDHSKTPNPQTPLPTPLRNPSVPTSSQILPKHHNFPLHKALLIAAITLGIIFLTAYVGVYYLLNQQLDKITKARNNVSPTTSPISQTPPTPTIGFPAGSQSIAGWLNYKTDKGKYSLSYPPNWSVKEGVVNSDSARQTINDLQPGQGEIQKVTFVEKDNIDAVFQVRSVQNSQNLTLDQVVIKDTAPAPTDTPPNTTKIVGGVTIDDIAAKQYSTFAFDHQEATIVFVKGNIIYYVSFNESNPNDPNFDENKKIYQEMLASFKFLSTTASPTIPQSLVACTQEAKQCSDGSYVSRSGPNCEFAACPN